MAEWSDEQLMNISALLALDDKKCDQDHICYRIKWLYHSKTRESLKSGVGGAVRLLSKVISRKGSAADFAPNDLAMPTYEELIYGLSKQLGVLTEGCALKDAEKYISHAIIIKALDKMKPTERCKFFEEQIDLGEIVGTEREVNAGLRGPLTTLAALGAANTAGFSLYLASTTALGFVTHAIGVTLPFAIYTGMTSTIAFVIGPVGWLAAGSWLVWRITGPDWAKLTPAIIYLINTRAAESANIAITENVLEPNSQETKECSDDYNPLFNDEKTYDSVNRRPRTKQFGFEVEPGFANLGLWKRIKERFSRFFMGVKSFFRKIFYVIAGVVIVVLIGSVVGMFLPKGNPVAKSSCYARGVAYYTAIGSFPTLSTGESAIGKIEGMCERSGGIAFGKD